MLLLLLLFISDSLKCLGIPKARSGGSEGGLSGACIGLSGICEYANMDCEEFGTSKVPSS